MRSLAFGSRSLESVTRAPAYLAEAASMIEVIRTSSDRTQGVRLLEQAAASLGADVAVMVTLVPLVGGKFDHHVVVACDPAWALEYAELSARDTDPWLEYARNHTEPVRASQLLAGLRERSRMEELASRFGFVSAVIVPVYSARVTAARGMLCLGSVHSGFFEDDGFVAFTVVARSVSMELHQWSIARLAYELVASTGLTDLEIALLSAEAGGSTTKMISREIGLTAAQVDYRFGRINKKLGSLSRTSSAQRLAALGLLMPKCAQR